MAFVACASHAPTRSQDLEPRGTIARPSEQRSPTAKSPSNAQPIVADTHEAPTEEHLEEALNSRAKYTVGPPRKRSHPTQEFMLILRDCTAVNHCADRVQLFRVHSYRSVTGRSASRTEIVEVPELVAANVLFKTAQYVARGSEQRIHSQDGGNAPRMTTPPATAPVYHGLYEASVIKDGVRRTLCIWLTPDFSYRVDLRPDFASGEPSRCDAVPPLATAEQLVSAPGRRIIRTESATQSEPPLPNTLTANEVDDAFDRVEPLLQNCTDRPRAKVRVTATITGWLGKISDAKAEGLGTAAAECLIGALRFAKFPLFEVNNLTIVREIDFDR
jgi:hypothetical protein